MHGVELNLTAGGKIMTEPVHAFDYLDCPSKPAGILVAFGDEPFLKQLVRERVRELVCVRNDTPAAVFDGNSVPWRDVHDELYTASLFNPSGPRVAIVEDADPFVTANRPQLEDYVERAGDHRLLVLQVTKWASNTRLFQRVGKHGLQVECRLPQTGRGKQKVVDEQRVVQWLVQWGRSRHDVALKKNAAALLLEFIGPELGVLDQELAKLALYAGTSGTVTEELVREMGGNWRAKTAWELIDAALWGNGAEAIAQLDRLLQSGEHPNALFGPISWSLRRFAAATRVYQQALREGRRMRLPDALEQGGFFKWQRNVMRDAEKQLKQLGQERAGQLYQWLLETDLALKGSHSSPARARLAMEKLIFRIDKHLAPRRETPPRPTS